MKTTITAPSDDGPVEAVRDAQGVWEINYPWFSERFAGTPTEVRARIRRTVKTQQQATGATPDQ